MMEQCKENETMRNYKITVAGTGYVGLSIATLLSQHHQVTAVDIVPEKVELINNRKSPIQDDYEELEEKITNQLRLFVGSIEEDREIYICDVPFTYQEVRGNRPGLENAKELIFIARTGKIFLGKHYNHINQMIKNGGKITYVTSEDFNTVRDTTEYKDNQDTALTILKRLKDIYPDRVNIGFLPTPVNISMYYLKLHDGTEYINVKFNFQTYHGNDKHPILVLVYQIH